jgi:hypothetical protein
MSYHLSLGLLFPCISFINLRQHLNFLIPVKRFINLPQKSTVQWMLSITNTICRLLHATWTAKTVKLNMLSLHSTCWASTLIPSSSHKARMLIYCPIEPKMFPWCALLAVSMLTSSKSWQYILALPYSQQAIQQPQGDQIQCFKLHKHLINYLEPIHTSSGTTWLPFKFIPIATIRRKWQRFWQLDKKYKDSGKTLNLTTMYWIVCRLLATKFQKNASTGWPGNFNFFNTTYKQLF